MNNKILNVYEMYVHMKYEIYECFINNMYKDIKSVICIILWSVE